MGTREASRGFTILETVVAIAMLAILGLGLTASLVSLMRLNAHNRSMSIARAAARSTMDEYIGLGAENLLLLGVTTASPLTINFDLEEVGTGTLGLRPASPNPTVGRVVLSLEQETPPLIFVQVVIEWTDELESTNKFEVSTFVTDRNLSE